jgi:hypothetical protein
MMKKSHDSFIKIFLPWRHFLDNLRIYDSSDSISELIGEWLHIYKTSLRQENLKKKNLKPFLLLPFTILFCVAPEKKIWKGLIGLRGSVYLYGFVIGL